MCKFDASLLLQPAHMLTMAFVYLCLMVFVFLYDVFLYMFTKVFVYICMMVLKGQFSIRTSTSQFDNPCVVINLHLVLLL